MQGMVLRRRNFNRRFAAKAERDVGFQPWVPHSQLGSGECIFLHELAARAHPTVGRYACSIGGEGTLAVPPGSTGESILPSSNSFRATIHRLEDCLAKAIVPTSKRRNSSMVLPQTRKYPFPKNENRVLGMKVDQLRKPFIMNEYSRFLRLSLARRPPAGRRSNHGMQTSFLLLSAIPSLLRP